MRSTNQDLTILAPSPQTRVLALYPIILSVLFILSFTFILQGVPMCPYWWIAKLICTFENQSPLNYLLLFIIQLNVQVCILDVLWCEFVQTMFQTSWFFVRQLYISGIFVCLGQYCIFSGCFTFLLLLLCYSRLTWENIISFSYFLWISF